ncbi:hypothetical protein M2175_002159 [Bradyrhizobium elkanii]|uniref:DUF4242 domain-containing protein n=1 Tax=Bradyrhizobium japonicum TaxID=375 RepID=A0A1L3F6D5_BRAJP|nr:MULTISPECIES: DUF4242 domain-containing protein [Bradyrhizobium]APG08853.1 hypothetical protein BKD09_10970 [Bradyrhizobium japonicum]MCS3927128.1 hypothetical protein [Bradyrhizobium elkanii]MCS3967681.1 hypothetical protein [Bradyrhizobium japonicum]
MPRFMIERNFAERLEMTKEGADRVNRINDEEGVRWLLTFLSADKRKTYCLYEAESAEAIRNAARRNDIPADVIIQVDEIRPAMFA